jgi:hypothetical protein
VVVKRRWTTAEELMRQLEADADFVTATDRRRADRVLRQSARRHRVANLVSEAGLATSTDEDGDLEAVAGRVFVDQPGDCSLFLSRVVLPLLEDVDVTLRSLGVAATRCSLGTSCQADAASLLVSQLQEPGDVWAADT